jgi:hypothetical protein
LPIREIYKINSPRGRPSMDLSTPFAATRPTRLLIDGTWVVSEGSGIDELMN